MLPADITAMVTSATASITTTLKDSLPLVLAVFASLVALGLAIRYIRKWIGKKA